MDSNEEASKDPHYNMHEMLLITRNPKFPARQEGTPSLFRAVENKGPLKHYKAGQRSEVLQRRTRVSNANGLTMNKSEMKLTGILFHPIAVPTSIVNVNSNLYKIKNRANKL